MINERRSDGILLYRVKLHCSGDVIKMCFSAVVTLVFSLLLTS